MSELSDPNQIQRHVLSDGDVSVAILSLGCITQDWSVPLNGRSVSVVQGYPRAPDYLGNPLFMGCIVGRVAGRISGAGFDWGGVTYRLDANELPNHLHGGSEGLHTRNWQMERDGDRAVQLQLHSPHGDQGYPGAVLFNVEIRLSDGWLSYDMTATTDRPTPISLAQHSYYNMAGGATVWDHWVSIPANAFVCTSHDLCATGQISPVDGQSFDFRAGQTIDRADPGRNGLDLTLTNLTADKKTPIRVTSPNGLELTMISDQPCVQIYTGAGLRPMHGQNHRRFQGLCLEPQGYPNAVNTAGAIVPVATPETPYRQTLMVRVAQMETR